MLKIKEMATGNRAKELYSYLSANISSCVGNIAFSGPSGMIPFGALCNYQLNCYYFLFYSNSASISIDTIKTIIVMER